MRTSRTHTFRLPLSIQGEKKETRIICQRAHVAGRNMVLVNLDWIQEAMPKAIEFLLLAEAVPCGVMIVHVRPDMFYAKYVNEGLLNMLDYTREECELQHKHNVLNFIYEEDVENGLAQFHSSIRKSGKFYVTSRLKKKNGELIWVNFMGKSIIHSDGEIYLYSVVTEIGDSLAVIEELYQEQQARSALEQFSPDIIMRYDALQDTVVFTGGLLKQFIDTPLKQYKLDDMIAGQIDISLDRPKMQHIIQTMLKGIVEPQQINCVDINGNTRILSLDYSFIHLKNGDRVSVVGKLSDITDQLEARKYYDKALALWHNHSEDALAAVTINVSKHCVVDGYSFFLPTKELQNLDLDDYIKTFEKHLINPGDLESLWHHLKPDVIKQTLRELNSRLFFEFEVSVDKQHRWIRLALTLLRNPHTGDLMALLKSTDMNDIKLRQRIDHLLYADSYEYMCVVFMRSNSYMLIATPDRQSGISSRLRNDYEKMTRRMVERFSLADNRDYLNYCFSIKNLKNQLVDSEKYDFRRGKNVDGEDIIYEIQPNNRPPERILLCTARNVSRKCEVLNFRTNRH